MQEQMFPAEVPLWTPGRSRGPLLPGKILRLEGRLGRRLQSGLVSAKHVIPGRSPTRFGRLACVWQGGDSELLWSCLTHSLASWELSSEFRSRQNVKCGRQEQDHEGRGCSHGAGYHSRDEGRSRESAPWVCLLSSISTPCRVAECTASGLERAAGRDVREVGWETGVHSSVSCSHMCSRTTSADRLLGQLLVGGPGITTGCEGV